MKIAILDYKSVSTKKEDFDIFNRLGEVVIYEKTEGSEVIDRLKGIDIALSNKVQFRREVLRECDSLKYIGLFATGYNGVDTEFAKEQSIAVANVPSYSTYAVAQHTIALILDYASKVSYFDEKSRSGAWEKDSHFFFSDKPIFELCGKTLGIIGYGEIGKKTAKIASALGMRVVYTSRSKKLSDEYAEEVGMGELIANSDIISLHCPLTPETKNLIDGEKISRMKEGVVIVNTARGCLIDEDALLEGIKSAKISHALLDVAKSEPVRAESPLYQSDKITLTPHIAWAPYETRKRLIKMAYDNLSDFIEGKSTNIVNK